MSEIFEENLEVSCLNRSEWCRDEQYPSDLQNFYQNFNPESAECSYSSSHSTTESIKSWEESSVNYDFGLEITPPRLYSMTNDSQDAKFMHNCSISSSRTTSTATSNSTYKYNQLKKIQKKKRKRTAFTTDQIIAMEQVFKTRPYIRPEEKTKLSERLNVSEKSIKIWFQNRRRVTEKRDEVYAPDSPLSEEMTDLNNDRLSYLEMQINERTDHFGNVTLDDQVMTELVSIIDGYISKDTPVLFDQWEDTPETNLIMYEPISPVSVLDDFLS